jgi:23S rRNA (adenine2030-N6)-methyltransferase
MLAYRHAFHAGNHADVLKHVVLAEVLRAMVAKPKPFTLVDTHAGAGGYSLEGRYAQKNAEHEDGIGRLWRAPDLPPALARYVELVRRFNGGGTRLAQYPGAPSIAAMLMRPIDRLHCHELHPTDERILRSALAGHPNARVTQDDGFGALERELPPPSRRGVLLIDPSYEQKTDYARTLGAVREALARFAGAVVLVWIPRVALVEARDLPRRLGNAAAAAPKGWLQAGLTVAPAAAGAGFGMTGSSMLVVNPPHELAATLGEVLPVLAHRLGRFDGATHQLELHLR